MHTYSSISAHVHRPRHVIWPASEILHSTAHYRMQLLLTQPGDSDSVNMNYKGSITKVLYMKIRPGCCEWMCMCACERLHACTSIGVSIRVLLHVSVNYSYMQQTRHTRVVNFSTSAVLADDVFLLSGDRYEDVTFEGPFALVSRVCGESRVHT